ncbi:Ig-like domain-containing protein [Butyrivibrio sp. WCE2006]|uniref:Ig-like domain-containing protein n=1 Tax=Butyrivibrio sp. WCE2006 TaxID=1410611 RepID=UPI0005D27D24|nr:Ig-like domain-containing protein [Butyrivibrio sp. WCE2006]
MRKRINWKNGICIALTASVCFTGFGFNSFAETGQNTQNTDNSHTAQDNTNTGKDQNAPNTGNTGNNQGSQNTGNNQDSNNPEKSNTSIRITATSITFKNSKEVITVGETIDLSKTVTINPDDALVTWESSSPGIAKVENGLVTALGTGTAVIKVVSDFDTSVFAVCEISVKDSKYYTQLIFPENELKIQPGEVETVQGVSYPGTVVDDVIKWESTNNDIATVIGDDKESKKAYISAENVGTCYIVAKVGNGAEIGRIKVTVGSPSGLEKTRIIKESVPTITYLKRNKGSFKIKYKAIEYASGYQIKYKKSGSWVTVNTTKKSVTVNKLPKGLYKVKVRAYRNYDGKKYYGKYSNTHKIKVK